MRREILDGIARLHGDTCGSLTFCTGLLDSLKVEVLKAPNVTTLADILEVALRCEAAALDTKAKSNTTTLVVGEVNAQAQPNAANAVTKPSWLPLNELPRNTCWRCGFMNVRNPAEHNSKNCRMEPAKFRWREAIKWWKENKGGAGAPRQQQQQPRQQQNRRPMAGSNAAAFPMQFGGGMVMQQPPIQQLPMAPPLPAQGPQQVANPWPPLARPTAALGGLAVQQTAQQGGQQSPPQHSVGGDLPYGTYGDF
jgi:hypothetical protein